MSLPTQPLTVKLCGPSNAALAILEAPSYFGAVKKAKEASIRMQPVQPEQTEQPPSEGNVEAVTNPTRAFFAQSVDLGDA